MRLIMVLLWACACSLSACGSSRTLSGAFSDIGADASLKRVLFADRRHDYSDIDITLHDGRLMLTGTMRSPDGHRRLIEGAWKAPGVTQVIDEVLVGDKTSAGQGFEDARIDQELRARWVRRGGVDSRNFKVSVSGGVVYILGRARDEQELALALQAAQSVRGVSRVVSHATTLYPAAPAYR